MLHNTPIVRPWIAIVIGSATLAACGGGSSGSESTSKPMDLTVVDSAASAASAAASASPTQSIAAATISDNAASHTAATPTQATSTLTLPVSSDSKARTAPGVAGQPALQGTDGNTQSAAANPSDQTTREAAYLSDDEEPVETRSTIQSLTAQPSTTATATPMVSLTSTDKIAELTSAAPLVTQTWSGINCYGIFGSYAKYGESGINGMPLPDKSTLRFGKITDPTNKDRSVIQFRVGVDDVLTAGGKRCETVAPPTAQTGIPVNEVFWYAFSIRMPEGNNAADNIILTQWHTLGFNPPWALYLKKGRLNATVRYNNNTIATQANTKIGATWVDTQPMGADWVTFVVQAKISPKATDKPFLKIWKNGKAVFNYQGPVGYNTTEPPYAKSGIYHWFDSTNTWDKSHPTRTMHLHKAILVRDANMKYNEPSLRNMLK